MDITEEEFERMMYNYELGRINEEYMKKTISVGVSMFPQDSTSIVKIMKFADIALYEAKTSGRNQVKRYAENPTDSLELF